MVRRGKEGGPIRYFPVEGYLVTHSNRINLERIHRMEEAKKPLPRPLERFKKLNPLLVDAFGRDRQAEAKKSGGRL